MTKNFFKYLTISLLLNNSIIFLNAAELRKLISSRLPTQFQHKQPVVLSDSEKFVKELYQKYCQTMTFLKMHEVSSSLTNELNKLFTSAIQDALQSILHNFDFLNKEGFRFFNYQVFTHEKFPQYIFKIMPCNLNYALLERYFLLNASRVWAATWASMIQNEFKIPNKRIYFMKSKYPELAIVVVASKFDFQNPEIIEHSEKQINVKKKISQITTLNDFHVLNIKNNMLIDTEARNNLEEFINDPFMIYDNPLRNKPRISKKLKSKL